jgi:hypothetical protein
MSDVACGRCGHVGRRRARSGTLQLVFGIPGLLCLPIGCIGIASRVPLVSSLGGLGFMLCIVALCMPRRRSCAACDSEHVVPLSPR